MGIDFWFKNKVWHCFSTFCCLVRSVLQQVLVGLDPWTSIPPELCLIYLCFLSHPVYRIQLQWNKWPGTPLIHPSRLLGIYPVGLKISVPAEAQQNLPHFLYNHLPQNWPDSLAGERVDSAKPGSAVDSVLKRSEQRSLKRHSGNLDTYQWGRGTRWRELNIYSKYLVWKW